MTELPLFPLSAVLLPYGRMPLRIFERRYLDLVRDCMKSGEPFGVVWIRRGSEVAREGRALRHASAPARRRPPRRGCRRRSRG